MTALPQTRPVDRASRIAAAALVATAVAIGIGRFAFTPLLPIMQADAGLSLADGGWLASANYLGYLLGALMPLALPMRAASSIRAALLLIAAATAAMGFVDSLVAQLLLRLLAGVACAWIMIFAFAWSLERLAPLGRPLLASLAFAGVGVGIAVVGLVCIVFMLAGTPSAHAWLLLGALTFVLAAVTWGSFAPDGAGGRGSSGMRADGPRWRREWLWLVFCFGASGFGYIIPATFLPVMAKQAVAEPLLFGLAWPIFGAAVLCSTLLAATVLARLGGLRLWMASQLVMALGVVLPWLWTGLGSIVLSALCIGGTFMVVTFVAMQEARKLATPSPERLMAAMTAAFACGQIAGPIAVSSLLQHGGELAQAQLAACALLLASVWILHRRSLAGAAEEGSRMR